MEVKLYSSNYSVDYGPGSLFERILHIFSDKRKLTIHGKHIKNRITNELISSKILNDVQYFNPKEWNIIEAKVRNDTGKLVNTTWEREIDDEKIRIVIGFRDSIKSVEIDKDFRLFQNPITKDGEIYEFVDKTNKKMLDKDKEAMIS